MLSIDLNCDMGESTHLWPYSIEKDLELLSHISSVNLACGFHAGDASTMHTLVDACIEKGIAIGAHPGFPDREDFGRREMTLSPTAIYDLMIYQIGALQAFLTINGAILHHVKPHGALYNMAAVDGVVADAIVNAVYDFNPNIALYGLAGGELVKEGQRKGLRVVNEVFSDRTYTPAGTLTPRSQPNASIKEPDDAIKQVMQMLTKGTVVATDGTIIPIKAETVCIHGDGANAISFAREIRQTLLENHITIKP